MAESPRHDTAFHIRKAQMCPKQLFKRMVSFPFFPRKYIGFCTLFFFFLLRQMCEKWLKGKKRDRREEVSSAYHLQLLEGILGSNLPSHYTAKMKDVSDGITSWNKKAENSLNVQAQRKLWFENNARGGADFILGRRMKSWSKTRFQYDVFTKRTRSGFTFKTTNCLSKLSDE